MEGMKVFPEKMEGPTPFSDLQECVPTLCPLPKAQKSLGLIWNEVIMCDMIHLYFSLKTSNSTMSNRKRKKNR